MKKIFLLIVFFYSGLCCYAQYDLLEKNLMESSDVYKMAASIASVIGGVIDARKQIGNENWKVYSFIEKDTTTYEAWINATGSQTRLVFIVNKNLIYSLVMNTFRAPKNPYLKDFSDTVEVAIMVKTGGDIYEIDYGKVKKSRLQNNDSNNYYEKIKLKNGSTLVIKNHIFVQEFTIKDNVQVYLPEIYVYESEK